MGLLSARNYPILIVECEASAIAKRAGSLLCCCDVADGNVGGGPVGTDYRDALAKTGRVWYWVGDLD
jgi:hypothetical protein